MTWIATITRIACGLLMLSYFGMMAFGELPEPRTAEASNTLTALFATGYFYPMMAALYLCIGICFVANRFVSLATLALVPVSLNVFLFHLMLSPGTLAASLLVGVPLLAMVLTRWRDFKRFLDPQA